MSNFVINWTEDSGVFGSQKPGSS